MTDLMSSIHVSIDGYLKYIYNDINFGNEALKQAIENGLFLDDPSATFSTRDFSDGLLRTLTAKVIDSASTLGKQQWRVVVYAKKGYETRSR